MNTAAANAVHELSAACMGTLAVQEQKGHTLVAHKGKANKWGAYPACETCVPVVACS